MTVGSESDLSLLALVTGQEEIVLIVLQAMDLMLGFVLS